LEISNLDRAYLIIQPSSRDPLGRKGKGKTQAEGAQRCAPTFCPVLVDRPTDCLSLGAKG